jgi:hypothetical protein
MRMLRPAFRPSGSYALTRDSCDPGRVLRWPTWMPTSLDPTHPLYTHALPLPCPTLQRRTRPRAGPTGGSYTIPPRPSSPSAVSAHDR